MLTPQQTNLLIEILACEKADKWFLTTSEQRDALVELARQGYISVDHVRPGITIAKLTHEGRRLARMVK